MIKKLKTREPVLPADLPSTLEEINCAFSNMIELPDNLPDGLKQLHCDHNNLLKLPNKLPTSLEQLWCGSNKLTTLPKKLPCNLKGIYCALNQITAFPKKLPDGLLDLSCDNNQLSALPNNLPDSLTRVICYCNKLKALPNKLPPNLKTLYCFENQLTILPDLPKSLTNIRLENNPLEANYPLIFTFNKKQDAELVAYVNERNREMREALNTRNTSALTIKPPVDDIQHNKKRIKLSFGDFEECVDIDIMDQNNHNCEMQEALNTCNTSTALTLKHQLPQQDDDVQRDTKRLKLTFGDFDECVETS